MHDDDDSLTKDARGRALTSFGNRGDTSEEQCFEQRKPNFDPAATFAENARFVEELESQLAREELDFENRVTETRNRLAPAETSQICAAFRMCKLHFDGDVSDEFVDAYVAESGVKPHGNEKLPYSRLIKAVIVNARRKGAPKSKRSRSRMSAYASAINLALDSGWSDSELEADLRAGRRNGERHGLDFLAAEGRRQRRGASASHNLPALIAKAIEALRLQQGDYAFVLLHCVGETIRLAGLQKRPANASGRSPGASS